MRRHLGYLGLGSEDRGAAAAIGNFDGVHLGHQAVLSQARDIAQAQGAPFGVVTFEPHPRSFFQPDAGSFRLMSAESRARRLEVLGVEQLYEIGFDRALSQLTAQEFVEQVLSKSLGLSHLVAGEDFRFGRNRGGDPDLLRQLGPEAGMDVTILPLVTGKGGEVSSTAIRAALSDGHPEEAARMLGHWHRIEGEVRHGEKRGRDLGFPTINLALDELHPPRFGVYATLVDVLDGPHRGRYQGAASLGERPTFGQNAPNLEVYLLDFDGDLYGAAVSVALVDFLRPELKFEDVDALVSQMDDDVALTRERLSTLDWT